jgi:endo-1,4-beta-xylanase
MHFTQVFTALTLAGSAFAAPPPKYEAPKPKPQPQGLATAMKARGREFIGTALTLRGNATEEAIASNGADFNSFVVWISFNRDFEN